ncbi:uncharacterized protein LOC132744468 isoform X3 [Ruditapes philippinarum]|uniref:uncharacterized protein LOC132744468 isoform X3 n=1 Tax=Ruditapes philippinarum TaxID=129788 RepID=UPI00295AF70F|nr:uncharacterized protein LOC132744468 isoform X3 [Ruditapes philippinarum]
MSQEAVNNEMTDINKKNKEIEERRSQIDVEMKMEKLKLKKDSKDLKELQASKEKKEEKLDLEVIRSLPEQLRDISIYINDETIEHKLDTLSKDADDLNKCLTKAFVGTENEVLEQCTMLSKMSCPSQIEIEKLSNTLSGFETDLRCCTHKIFAMKQSINSFIGINQSAMKSMEDEIESAKIEVEGLDKVIYITENEIRKYEEEAANEERDAVELEDRAKYLKRKAREYKDNGFLWGIGSTVVGLLFAPVTFGMSFGAGLASAGIGMKVNYDSASECKRSASRLRTSAEDKRSTARSKKTLKGELESKKILKNTELQLYQTKIENLSKTCDRLTRLENLLIPSVAGFECAITIAQDFKDMVNGTNLQCDSFRLIKEVCIDMDCPDDLDDETEEEMRKLKDFKDMGNGTNLQCDSSRPIKEGCSDMGCPDDLYDETQEEMRKLKDFKHMVNGPDDLCDETQEEMRKLKAKWRELMQMFKRYHDNHGKKF